MPKKSRSWRRKVFINVALISPTHKLLGLVKSSTVEGKHGFLRKKLQRGLIDSKQAWKMLTKDFNHLPDDILYLGMDKTNRKIEHYFVGILEGPIGCVSLFSNHDLKWISLNGRIKNIHHKNDDIVDNIELYNLVLRCDLRGWKEEQYDKAIQKLKSLEKKEISSKHLTILKKALPARTKIVSSCAYWYWIRAFEYMKKIATNVRNKSKANNRTTKSDQFT